MPTDLARECAALREENARLTAALKDATAVAEFRAQQCAALDRLRAENAREREVTAEWITQAATLRRECIQLRAQVAALAAEVRDETKAK